MFILKKGHQPGVYVPLRALFLVFKLRGLQGCISYLIAVTCYFTTSSRTRLYLVRKLYVSSIRYIQLKISLRMTILQLKEKLYIVRHVNIMCCPTHTSPLYELLLEETHVLGQDLEKLEDVIDFFFSYGG